MTILTDEQVRALLDGATPGPWRLIDDPEAGEPAQCIRAKGWDIATAWGGYSAAEIDANLLCAAPDLARDLLAARAELARVTAALADLVFFIEGSGFTTRFLDRARAALAEIKGESHD
jgi:hypothetical protein